MFYAISKRNMDALDMLLVAKADISVTDSVKTTIANTLILLC